MMKASKMILFSAVGLISLIILIAAIFVWYNFFDISPLDLYKNQTIHQIYVYSDCIYLVDEDGKGYVSGGFNADLSSMKSDKNVYRGYLNTENRLNKKTNLPYPILFFDGQIKQMFPYSSMKSLFITEQNELYSVDCLTVKKIANEVVFAEYDITKSVVYVIDENATISLINGGNKTGIASGVKSVVTYNGRAFVLLVDGNLCEIIEKDGVSEISAPIFQNVKDFDVVNTSARYYDKWVFDDAEALENPLFNVLTNDGKLYAKGYYNITECGTVGFAPYPAPVLLSDWTIIGTDVDTFSCSAMGTIMKFKDKTCSYYGYDTVLSRDPYFGSITLDIDNVEKVIIDKLSVCVIDSSGNCYIWGDDFLCAFLKSKDEHINIFADSPLVVSLN